MRESIHFTFNNISSEDMGVSIASPKSGLYQETFLPTRNIIETKISSKNKPYHKKVELEPLSFSLFIFINDWKERDNLRQIARWLFQDYYKPLWFNDNPDRIYYAIVEGSSTLNHNGMKDGYIELNFRCNSPFTYSPPIFTSLNSSVRSYVIDNEGDLVIKPKLRLKKTIANGNIQIKNVTTNQTIILTDIQVGEEIFIDFENEEIVSSLQYLNIYRYANHNDVWLEFTMDDGNLLEFTGDFTMEFEHEYIYLAD